MKNPFAPNGITSQKIMVLVTKWVDRHTIPI